MPAKPVLSRSLEPSTSSVPSGTFGEFGKTEARSALGQAEAGTGTFRKTPASPQPALRASDSFEELSWEHEISEVQKLTLPPDVLPGDIFPDIESALLAAAEQLHRRPSQPELPPIADLHRRTK